MPRQMKKRQQTGGWVHNSQSRPDALPETPNALGPPNVADGVVKSTTSLGAEHAAVKDADKLLRRRMRKGGHAASITGGW